MSTRRRWAPEFATAFAATFFALTSGLPKLLVHEMLVDKGENVSLPCPLVYDTDDVGGIMWAQEGRHEREQLARFSPQEDGSLFLFEVNRNDSGTYTCSTDASDLKASVVLRVRSPPWPLTVTVHPSTILALIIWAVGDTGGYPIVYFTAQYRLADADEEWRPISPNRISPTARQIEVYKLEPNTTYDFRVWGSNQLGKGEISQVRGRTLHNNQELELARHFLTDADKFDTRMWFLAVAIVMGTLVVLGLGTCLLLYQECRSPRNDADDQEVIELVPNIILNPGFDGNSQVEQVPADENCNHETSIRLNNNTVVRPGNF